jgi:chromosome segregation ATPase
MDAVCFVLGLPARYMRGKQLKDLIHDPAAERDADAGDEVPARPRRAYVKAVYSLDDDEVSLLGLPVGTQETEFTRVLTADGTSTYRLDNAPVSLEAFNQRLEKLGIVVAARNFLIFQVFLQPCCYDDWSPPNRDLVSCGFGAQGDVESLASRKSEELLKFFESVSGSDKYMCVLRAFLG